MPPGSTDQPGLSKIVKKSADICRENSPIRTVALGKAGNQLPFVIRQVQSLPDRLRRSFQREKLAALEAEQDSFLHPTRWP